MREYASVMLNMLEYVCINLNKQSSENHISSNKRRTLKCSAYKKFDHNLTVTKLNTYGAGVKTMKNENS